MVRDAHPRPVRFHVNYKIWRKLSHKLLFFSFFFFVLTALGSEGSRAIKMKGAFIREIHCRRQGPTYYSIVALPIIVQSRRTRLISQRGDGEVLFSFQFVPAYFCFFFLPSKPL